MENEMGMGKIIGEFLDVVTDYMGGAEIDEKFLIAGSLMETTLGAIVSHIYTGVITRDDDKEVLEKQILLVVILLEHLKRRMNEAENIKVN